MVARVTYGLDKLKLKGLVEQIAALEQRDRESDAKKQPQAKSKASAKK